MWAQGSVTRRLKTLLGALGVCVLLASCHARRQVEPPPLTLVPRRPDTTEHARSRSLQPPDSLRRPFAAANRWKPGVPERPWRYIVLHHTAADSGSVASIDAQHRERLDANGNPWLGVGYHFVIGNGDGMKNGEIEPTFRWKEQIQGAHAGAQNRDYNEYGIGIALVGNFQERAPSVLQRLSAARLVRTLRKAYGITADRVVAHRDIRNTECPGKMFPLAAIVGASGFASHTAAPSPAPGRVGASAGDRRLTAREFSTGPLGSGLSAPPRGRPATFTRSVER